MMASPLPSYLSELIRAGAHQLLNSSVQWPDRYRWSSQAKLVAKGSCLDIDASPTPVACNENWLATSAALDKLAQILAQLACDSGLASVDAARHFFLEAISRAVLQAALSLANHQRPAVLFASLNSSILQASLSQVVHGVYQDMQTRQITFRFHRRLQGVEIHSSQVQLSPGTWLQKLDDQQLTERLPGLDTFRLGLLSPDEAPLHRVEIQIERCEELRELRQYHSGPSRPVLFFRDSERVLEALLLLHCDSQIELGTGYFRTALLGPCGRKKRAQSASFSPPTLLKPDDEGQLSGYYEVAQEIQKYPNLRAALHRYVLATSRQRAEDCLVDVVIGLESILLYGLQNELSHRFSLNGSSLCRWILGTPRYDGYRLLRSAYSARSSIVHGYGKKLKASGLETLANEIRVLLSQMMVWLVRDAQKYGLPVRFESDDWLRVLFDTPELS